MISTKTIHSLAFSLFLGGLSISEAYSQTRRDTTIDPAATCQVLSNAYPDLTYSSNETEYTALNEGFWSAAEWLGPACIFAPTSAELMSFAVKTLADSGVKFAIQGGGHMPIAGAANIDSTGILLSSSGLNQLSLSEDGSTLSVGPGNRWGDVYDYLELTGKTIVGGRMGVVGVPGLLLGGGISFFSYEHGWASANIASYQGVLANGTIFNATADNEFADLYWSLRGGGNSFAIVTNFELKTLDVPGVTVGQVDYTGNDLRDQFLQAVYNFAHNGMQDPKATVTPMISQYAGSSELSYSAMVFYNDNNTNPSALVNFTGTTESSLPVNSSTFSYRNMKSWSDEIDTGFNQTHGLYVRFYVIPILADLDAMGVVVDTFFDETATLLSNVTGGVVTLAVMPISETYILANRGNSTAGDPMGIDASKAPFVWVEQSWLYVLGSDTAYMESVMATVNDKIDENLAQLGDGVRTPYLYLNDADKGQPVFEGYNQDNVAKLQEIRNKYDPSNIYTDQMPGGFKVAHVNISST